MSARRSRRRRKRLTSAASVLKEDPDVIKPVRFVLQNISIPREDGETVTIVIVCR